MAVAGFQNVSMFDSSFHRESRSPLSRRWANHDRPSARASSLLQMWREIEGEHVVNRSQLRVGDRLPQETVDGLSSNPVNTYFPERQDNHGGDSLQNGTENANECQAWPQGQMGLQNDNEEGSSSSSEQSIDFGDAERGRVRQIFQEWMNNGSTGRASNCSQANRNLTAQQLEENEYERVRNVREWVRLTSQQRGTCNSGGEGQAAEIAARVHNGSFVNQREFGARRNIRKLCGRQALVDLLARAKQERQRELQHLLEHRPVSDFAHRNRIQSLLRGRFLRSGRLVQDKKPSSLAANELGLLRQRHTVAGLREGFLSRLDNFDRSPSVSARSDTSSNIDDINNFVNENTQTNSLQVNLNVNQEWFGPRNGVRDTNQSCTFPLEGDTGQDTINWQEATAQGEQYVRNFENEENRLPSSSPVSLGKSNGIGENIGESCGESAANSWLQENSGVEGQEEHVQCHQLSSHEVPEHCEPSGEECEQSELSGEECEVHVSLNHADNHESSTTEGMHWPPTSVQVEEWREPFADNAGSDWQPENDYEFREWRDEDAEGTYGNGSEGTANDWAEETLRTEGGEEHHVQELDGGWHDNDLQEATDNFLDEPFSWQAASAGRLSTSYFPDDDNTYSSEIRELLNRRSVSNLLQSDFRVSLDQLIQSYAERQAHASDNWEPDDGTSLSPSSPALVEEDVQNSGAQDQGQSDVAEGGPLVLPAQPFTPQPFWDQELLDDNWSQNHSRHGLGIEWEIVNDLRIDMARLQQRMNNMQRMLEACMDMQLELQRAVRQELSAALNMSAGSTVSDDNEHLEAADQSKWYHVRKGICCMCCDKSIDSLLYRCGHMCTCSKCADKLVQRGGKCPMCQAPVVEMIRAYFAQ